MYWSRPDVARAHGATNWPQKCAPRGNLLANQVVGKVVTPEGAAALPVDHDSEPHAMQPLGESRECPDFHKRVECPGSPASPCRGHPCHTVMCEVARLRLHCLRDKSYCPSADSPRVSF